MVKKTVCNILFSTDERMGGTVVAAVELARACATEIPQLFITGPTDTKYNYINDIDLPVYTLKLVSILGFSIMPSLGNVLNKYKDIIGILHIHGMWNFYNIQAVIWAKKNGIPVIWTVHGELDPVRIRSKILKKYPYFKLLFPFLRKEVNVIRAITKQEKKYILNHGFNNKVIIIPNGVNTQALSSGDDKMKFKKLIGADPQKKILLFASRISPEKGIELLLNSFNSISKECSDWELVVAGSTVGSTNEWLRKIKSIIESNSQIRYIGHWPANDKATLFNAADCFILPSMSDVMSLVVMEASSYSIPSIITVGCDFNELYETGGSFMIKNTGFMEELKAILTTPIIFFFYKFMCNYPFINKYVNR
nr:glycosyltransferase [Bacteroidota bacterium]